MISFSKWPEIFKQLQELPTDSLIIISDQEVWKLYGHKLEGLNFSRWVGPSGESLKSFSQLEECLEFFLQKGIHRRSHLVALGGGAVSDFAGFVATLLLRGISWSVIPTTLLGMVDASIGGKVGINSRWGKNLIGAFHLPQHIWIDLDFIKTQEETHLQSARGEIVKYGMLSPEIAQLIMSGKELSQVVRACAEFKLNIVQTDFKESGERKLLNLGHTLGHVLERICKLPHGLAVLFGMELLLELFPNPKGKDLFDNLKKAMGLSSISVPWQANTFSVSQLYELLEKDKKKVDQTEIDLVVYEQRAICKRISLDQLKQMLKQRFHE